MTKKELKALKDGTLIYNGHTEAEIKTVAREKVIEICIPIDSLKSDSQHFDEIPEHWMVLEE